ncbi:Two-component signal transduction system YycFG, regulatory protein YycH [Terribacillus halophilus]|uniref:Two-component signal transduction system YycFG, regulatory protein YycH n=1 Tax=Terribacillus halophilus TaxID=361279 RepID=A0A1G6LV63_9BACI|nr:two-component system activity regulator YycH [Terribacillus halophilus]SDC47110.1 Two-component signal transduction system YycFG, regulatory protein YycH [Terribacillus halophilus]
MKLETFNTILLVILVAMSLILTAYVWTFQPNSLKSEGIGTEEAKTLGGVEKQLADVVRPTHIYVHNGDNHFVFKSKEEEQVFTDGLADWTLTNTKLGSLDELPKTNVELVYPVTIAYSQLNALFQVEGAENVTSRLGDGGFTKLYLEPNEDNTTDLIFVNDRQEDPLHNVVTATVTNNIQNTILAEDSLTAAVPLSETGTNDLNQIFLPEEIVVKDSNVRGETISRNAFAEIYMDNNYTIQGTDQYTDSNLLEMIKFSNNGQFASYQYSSTSPGAGTTNRAEQMQAAINTINTHKGWTDDYNLYAVSGESNFTFQFRMMNDGYPVFQTNGLSLITIRMQSTLPEPVSYERTLLDIGVSGGSRDYKLTVQQVRDWLENNKYNPRDIQDVVIGYRLDDNDSDIYKYHLKPSWYVKYEGEWNEVKDSETGGES